MVYLILPKVMIRMKSQTVKLIVHTPLNNVTCTPRNNVSYDLDPSHPVNVWQFPDTLEMLSPFSDLCMSIRHVL